MTARRAKRLRKKRSTKSRKECAVSFMVTFGQTFVVFFCGHSFISRNFVLIFRKKLTSRIKVAAAPNVGLEPPRSHQEEEEEGGV